MKLLIATHNLDKLREIRAIFALPGLDILDMHDIPDLPDVEEDGDTFRANAEKKAVTLARATGLRAMADDSGLCVDALDGAPGVLSARYAGEPADYEANNSKLLKALSGRRNRSARFHCAVALAEPDGDCRVVEATCEGRITEEPRGRRGFGYDPLFVPEGHQRTFAEMAPELKHRISHRAKAFKLASQAWSDILQSQ